MGGRRKSSVAQELQLSRIKGENATQAPNPLDAEIDLTGTAGVSPAMSAKREQVFWQLRSVGYRLSVSNTF